MPTVLDIIREHLTANGYDGLYNTDGECACELSDLAPCGGITGECRPGHKIPCDGEGGSECMGDCYFHITELLPAPAPGDAEGES